MGFTINLPGIIPSLEDFETSAPIGLSPLGTPVFDDITFPAGNYPNADGENIYYEELHIQSAAIVITQSKNIVKTQIAGRNGTIKEYISLGDYTISINAKITELANLFPAEQMQIWSDISKVPKNINIISKLINKYCDVYKVVIESFSIKPIQGSLNELDLNIELSSDEDINLDDYSEINTAQYL